MRGSRRTIAALALALMCAPVTWLRSDVSWDPPKTIGIEQIARTSGDVAPCWTVAGVWHYSARSLSFGGFSALVALPDHRLMAFSDRGARFVLDEPGSGQHPGVVARQDVALPRRFALPDIEAATLDPGSGTYWLTLENGHTVQRFGPLHEMTGVRALRGAELGWTNNTGAEAMVRLADGRFVILPEGRRTGLVFAGDPVADGRFATFDYLPPIPGHAATDMAQLPDGRLLLLLRNLDLTSGFPPFESKIAVAPAPRADQAEPWAPEIAIDLDGVIPRENYEGMAVRLLADGKVAVWLIADDNLSVMQRTLLVQLIVDPNAI